MLEFLARFAVVAIVAFCLFPALLLAFGILMARANRRAELAPPAARAGRLLLAASVAALALPLIGSIFRTSPIFLVTEWTALAVLITGLALCGWLLGRGRVRPLQAFTGALFADMLVLVAFLPLGIWVSGQGQHIAAYSNSNEVEVRAALAKNPNDAAAHSSLAHIDMMRGDHVGEVAEWRQVLLVEPGNEDALFLLGARLAHTGRADETRPLYQKLAAGDGPYADAARHWLARQGER